MTVFLNTLKMVKYMQILNASPVFGAYFEIMPQRVYHEKVITKKLKLILQI